MLSVHDYLTKLEMDLMVGSGRWVADFSESIWDRVVGDVRFAMVITGGMRGRGFFISRVVNWLFLPNYRVACFVYTTDYSLTNVQRTLDAIEGFRREQDVAWCWLVIPRQGNFSRRDKAVVAQNDTR